MKNKLFAFAILISTILFPAQSAFATSYGYNDCSSFINQLTTISLPYTTQTIIQNPKADKLNPCVLQTQEVKIQNVYMCGTKFQFVKASNWVLGAANATTKATIEKSVSVQSTLSAGIDIPIKTVALALQVSLSKQIAITTGEATEFTFNVPSKVTARIETDALLQKICFTAQTIRKTYNGKTLWSGIQKTEIVKQQQGHMEVPNGELRHKLVDINGKIITSQQKTVRYWIIA